MKIYMGKNCITREVTHITFAWYVRSISNITDLKSNQGLQLYVISVNYSI